MTLDFMILGAQKAATSSLQQALRTLPGISMPPGESAFFEDPDFHGEPWVRLRAEVGREVKLGIKRPDSLCRDDVRERIAATHPGARFIVVLREPVSRAVSAYFHLARHGHIRADGPDEAIRRGLRDHRRGETTVAASLVEFGLYGANLEAWFNRYSSDRFLVLGQPEVAKDLVGVLARSCELIGAPVVPVQDPSGIREENVGAYDPRTFRFHRWGQLMKTSPLPGTSRRIPRRSAVLRAAGHSLVTVAQGLSRTGTRPPALASSVQEQLGDVYLADLSRLRDLVPPAAIYWAS